MRRLLPLLAAFPDWQRVVLFESGSGASVEYLILETNVLDRVRRAP